MTDDPADDQVPSWSRDGKWIYFGSRRSGRMQVWRLPAEGGKPEQVTHDGGFAPAEGPDGKYLYYLKSGGLWRAPLGGGAENRIIDAVFDRSFSVTDQGVYFMKSLPLVRPGPGAIGVIQFLRFSSGQLSEVFRVPKPVFAGFSVSPDGRSILYTQLDRLGADLMLVENFR